MRCILSFFNKEWDNSGGTALVCVCVCQGGWDGAWDHWDHVPDLWHPHAKQVLQALVPPTPDPICRSPRAVCQQPMTAMTKEGSLERRFGWGPPPAILAPSLTLLLIPWQCPPLLLFLLMHTHTRTCVNTCQHLDRCIICRVVSPPYFLSFSF